MKSKKLFTSFLVSVVTMMLCLVSFAGTTLAWFTDTVSNTGNKIQAGTLDVELWQDGSNMTDAQKAAATQVTEEGYTNYYDISDSTVAVFNYDKWEPGYSTPAGFVIKNAGNLALKYKLSFSLIDSKTGLEQLDADYSDESNTEYLDKKAHLEKCEANTKLENVIEVYQGETKLGTLKDFFDGTKQFEGELLLQDETASISDLKLLMPTTAGNEYENASISFDIKLLATQLTHEYDGFENNQYDAQATFPVVAQEKVETNKPTKLLAYDDNNKLAAQAEIPAAAQETGGALAGVSKVEMTVDETDKPTGITLETGEQAKSYDVKFFSVTSDGTKTQITDFGTTIVNVDLSAQIPDGADLVKVYHTHNGVSTEMTKINTSADDVTDGKFYYDVTKKILTVGSSTFSPFTFVYMKSVAMVVETDAKYNSLQAAINAAGNGQTAKLLVDVPEGTALSVASGKNITVDLGGFTYTSSGVGLTNNGTLTLINGKLATQNEGLINMGTIVDLNCTIEAQHSDAIHNYNGTINKISDGRYIGGMNELSSAEHALRNEGTVNEIAGGYFHANHTAIRTNTGTINLISGGYFDHCIIRDDGTIYSDIGYYTSIIADQYEPQNKVKKVTGGVWFDLVFQHSWNRETGDWETWDETYYDDQYYNFCEKVIDGDCTYVEVTNQVEHYAWDWDSTLSFDETQNQYYYIIISTDGFTSSNTKNVTFEGSSYTVTRTGSAGSYSYTAEKN